MFFNVGGIMREKEAIESTDWVDFLGWWSEVWGREEIFVEFSVSYLPICRNLGYTLSAIASKSVAVFFGV